MNGEFYPGPQNHSTAALSGLVYVEKQCTSCTSDNHIFDHFVTKFNLIKNLIWYLHEADVNNNSNTTNIAHFPPKRHMESWINVISLLFSHGPYVHNITKCHGNLTNGSGDNWHWIICHKPLCWKLFISQPGEMFRSDVKSLWINQAKRNSQMF